MWSNFLYKTSSPTQSSAYANIEDIAVDMAGHRHAETNIKCSARQSMAPLTNCSFSLDALTSKLEGQRP